MKKTFLFFLFAFFISWNPLKAQSGGDYIVVMDNSDSIAPFFDDMSASVKRVIERILSCDPNNRVAVVHYGTGILNFPYGPYTPRIYAESDFTNNLAVATGFTRRFNVGDHFHEALGLIGNALDNVTNPNIIGPQTTLNRNFSVPLKIILFTDAERSNGDLVGGSYLVNYFDPTPDTAAAFSNINSFKANRGAIFSVVHLNNMKEAKAAGAAIASLGGSYMGNVEINPGDPQNNNVPRLYYSTTDFLLTPKDVKEIVANVCNYSWSGGTVEFWHESQGCGLQSVQSVWGDYSLPAGANFVGLKLFLRDINTGNEVPVDFNPSWPAANSFYQWLYPSDFPSPPSGGQHKFLLKMIYEIGGIYYEALSYNQYPFFPIDFDLDCSYRIGSSSLNRNTLNYKVDRNGDPNHVKERLFENKQKIQITPNPTNGPLKIIPPKGFKNVSLEVSDLNGNIIYKNSFKDEKEINIDLNGKKEGVYLVKIISDKNGIYTEKIIKK
jgi:hypothetical protein